ncbi:hypothetical protein [Ehrlichia muris]|uniref:Uncharacterized protein n=1 Tax=Ehrlichia muris AS145 TaxID=1423892 RepID=V9R7D1_9RICK|nr:hypothetical protein [Ehrlichia muris]AHC39690.1 hypothetical protein EMUR_01780 [Ehrlichia muris AS145]
MEVNMIMMTLGSMSVVITASVGLILSCVNMRHNNCADIMDTVMFAFLLIIVVVLFYANRMGVKYDKLVEILYDNTIPDYVVPPYESETSILSKLKKIFVRGKSSQVCQLPVSSMNPSDSSSYDMDNQGSHKDNSSVTLSQVICDTNFMSCDNLDSVVGSHFDIDDFNIEVAERMIQQSMLSRT